MNSEFVVLVRQEAVGRRRGAPVCVAGFVDGRVQRVARKRGLRGNVVQERGGVGRELENVVEELGALASAQQVAQLAKPATS